MLSSIRTMHSLNELLGSSKISIVLIFLTKKRINIYIRPIGTVPINGRVKAFIMHPVACVVGASWSDDVRWTSSWSLN